MAHRSRVSVVLVPLLAALFAALMQPALAAQVPPGSGVRMAGSFPLAGGTGGLTIVDPVSGDLTPVVDLSTDGRQAFAGLIDPSNGRVIVGGGGLASSAGTIRKVRLTGAVVSGETVLVDLGNPDVQDLALDRDGNYVAVQSGQLAIVSRQTGQVTTFDTDHYEGEMTALAVDAETNRCWVATTTTTAFEDNVLIEYDLDDGPGPGVLLASLSFNGHMNFINGLAYDGTDSLYLGGNDFFDAPRLLRYTLSTGQITDVAPALPEISIAGVHVDLRTGELHFAETAAPLFPASWYVVDPEVGVATPVATWAPAQEYARALDLNDWIDRTALFPRHASASASTLVEMSAHGLPGELGYLAVVAINGSPIAPLIVGTGFMNSGGYYALSATLSPGMLPAGLSFTLISARRDLTTGHVTIGTQAELSVGP